MSSETSQGQCGSQCSSCSNGAETENKEKTKEPLLPLAQNELSKIKRVLAVISGKGGVGKSSVSALIAVGLARQGWKAGILDADITGPSIPKMFGLHSRPEGFDSMILPVQTSTGIKVMSLNLLLPQEDDPVIWRGPLLASVVKQFWTDVAWGELDCLIVDLPPGTGDVPLTVMQSLPLDEVVVVTSPQDLASLVVRKAVKMARKMNVPVLGLVQNMSYVVCPACGEKINVFGNGHSRETARLMGLELLAELPLDPRLAELCDLGRVEEYNPDFLQGLFASLGRE
ncbi:MAG: Mrp/NBP35 family ATP-binding protein [Desulfotomaculales bacterium]